MPAEKLRNDGRNGRSGKKQVPGDINPEDENRQGRKCPVDIGKRSHRHVIGKDALDNKADNRDDLAREKRIAKPYDAVRNEFINGRIA